ncbi:MAG TPA: peroxiredoxin [Planctomycetaceae bacterium]|jgi:peroxiredoxin Q/BCP
MKRAQFLVVAGLLLALATAHAEDKAVLKEGDKAPSFDLKGSDGKEYTLRQFAGKQAVVIAWFPKAFTGGCTKECKSMRENGEKIRKFDVAYFTASCDTPEENKKFAESLMLDYPILSDPTTEVAKAYGVVHEGRKVPERWTFYIDKDGVVKSIDKKVTTDSHGEDIAKKLEELGVAKKK